jgi:glycine oxidase
MEKKHVTAQGPHRLLSLALESGPALGSAPVQETWAGFRPYTDDHPHPAWEPDPCPASSWPPVTSARASPLAPVTARLVAEVVLGKSPSVDLTPFRFDRFPRRQASG